MIEVKCPLCGRDAKWYRSEDDAAIYKCWHCDHDIRHEYPSPDSHQMLAHYAADYELAAMRARLSVEQLEARVVEMREQVRLLDELAAHYRQRLSEGE